MLTSVRDWTEKGRSRFALPAVPVAVWIFLGLAAAIPIYVFAITAAGQLGLFSPPVLYYRTFNSMLLHLLAGRFDIDAAAIGDEGVLRGGLVYAYFGIVPALARLPLLWMPGFAFTDFTRVACLVAVVIMAGFKLLSVATVWRARGRPERDGLLILFAVAVLLGGAQLEFLKPSVFQEVLLWADVLSAGFVYFVLRGYYSGRGFSTGILTGMAITAGLCLLTRVSTALGLYTAFGLLWLGLAWRVLRDRNGPTGLSGFKPLLVSAAIILAFAGLAGFINFMRWGSPFAFTDTRHYLISYTFPAFAQWLQEYGVFSFGRVGYMLAYYLFPIWIFRNADGSFLWESFQQRAIHSIELPPSSFFISDPLLIGLAGYFLIHLVRHDAAANRTIAVPVLAGLAVPIGLILTFFSAAFRYRLEFYPFLEFSAFLGFGLLLSRALKSAVRLFAFAAYGSIVGGFIEWLLYTFHAYQLDTQTHYIWN